MIDLKEASKVGIKWTTLGTVGLSVFQLLQIAILTRILPKEAFGLVAMALFMLRLTNIFANLGMTVAILSKQEITTKEYSSVYWLNFMISIFLYVILFLTSGLVTDFYGQPELLRIIPLLSLNLLFSAIGKQHRTILQKEFKFKRISIIDICSFVIGFVAAVILANNDFGVYSLVYSSLLASVLSNLAFFVVNFRQHPIMVHFRIGEIVPFFKIGGYSMGSSLLDFFSKDFDILIIGKLLGAESLGVYSLLKNIVLKLFSIINPTIVTVFSPLFSSIQKDRSRLKNAYLKLIRNISYVNFLVYLLLIVNSKDLLDIVYGSDYNEYYPVLCLFACAFSLTALANPISSLIIATGRTDIGFQWTILRILLSPLVVYLGAQVNIETVAAYYALLTLFLTIPSWFIMIRRISDIGLTEYIGQFYKPLVLFVIFGYLGFRMIDDVNFPETILLRVAILSFITIGLYVNILYLIDKKEIKEFLSYLNLKKTP